MGNPLSNLITLICTGDDLRDKIAQKIQEEYRRPLSIEEGVERILWHHDVLSGAEILIDSRAIAIKILADLNVSCSPKASFAEAIQELLQVLGFPLPARGWPIGAVSIKKELETILEEVIEFDRLGRIEDDHLTSRPIHGWAYIESLLKTTIQFYLEFLTSTDPSISEKFNEAQRKESLRPMLQAMRSIEKQFTPRDDQSNQELIEQCLRLFDRPSPFANFPFDQYDNDVVIEQSRNFYAHTIRDAVREKGVADVKNSLQNTIQLVKDLIDYRIAPSVIFPTTRGYDEYGRKLLWFLTEKKVRFDLINDVYSYDKRKKHEQRIYKQNFPSSWMMRPCLTISPINENTFNPPIILVSELNRGKQNDET